MEPLLKELESALGAVVRRFNEELRAIRSNRPSVELLESIKVMYYDQPLSVQQLGSLSIRPPRDIEIQVWDKSAVAPLVKAIEDAKMGLTVTNDGNIVRVSLPSMTDERRAEFEKLVRKMSETSHIQVRSIRDDVMKKVKSAEDAGTLSEDQAFKGKEQVPKIVDEANKKIEAALENKIRELKE